MTTNPLLKGDRYSCTEDKALAWMKDKGYPTIDERIPFDNLKAHAVIDRDPGDENPESYGVERDSR